MEIIDNTNKKFEPGDIFAYWDDQDDGKSYCMLIENTERRQLTFLALNTTIHQTYARTFTAYNHVKADGAVTHLKENFQHAVRIQKAELYLGGK